MPFSLYTIWEKENNVPCNNFKKFKRIIVIFGKQH